VRYEAIPYRERAELELLLASRDPEDVASALFSAAWHDPDWQWVESVCLTHLKSESVQIRRAATTSLELIAVVHKKLHLDLVLPALHDALSDVEIAGDVEMTLSIIRNLIRTN
jgi:hypothetical protein